MPPTETVENGDLSGSGWGVTAGPAAGLRKTHLAAYSPPASPALSVASASGAPST